MTHRSENTEAGGGALAGVRVLDLSRVLAGPLCGQMLADQGATVIKVEGPQGDETRGWGPPFSDDGGSAYFDGLNRGKRNISLDLSTVGGQSVLNRLLDWGDVVVENFKLGTMERWGFGYEDTLAARYPELVYCRISGFGGDGPMGGRPGYDALLQAYGGLMSVNGEPGGDPLRVGAPIVDLTAAQIAFSGIVLALYERSRSGLGQMVDVSLLDAVVALLHPHSAAWLADGRPVERSGNFHPMVVPYQIFHAADMPVFVAATDDRKFASLCEVLERADLVEDHRFVRNVDRVANRQALVEQLEKAFADREAEYITTELLARGVPAGPVNSVGEALSSPQVLHRDLVIEIGGYRAVGIPLKLSRTPGAVTTVPAKRGIHTAEILDELGFDADERAQLLDVGAAFESR